MSTQKPGYLLHGSSLLSCSIPADVAPPMVGMQPSGMKHRADAPPAQHTTAAQKAMPQEGSVPFFMAFLVHFMFAKGVNSGISLHDSELDPSVL